MKCSGTPIRKIWHCKKFTYKTDTKNAKNEVNSKC